MTDAEKLKLYEHALRDIADFGTERGVHLGWMSDEDWHRIIAFSAVRIAARALSGERNEDDYE